MKLLLILGSDDNYSQISRCVNSLGFDIIRYNHVQKAMDNIDEINPRAIVISARDFPRHWKILVQFIRSERSKEACPIILLRGDSFSTEESSKASFLEVNGVVAESLDTDSEMEQFKSILQSYSPMDERRRYRRFQSEFLRGFGFVFVLPVENKLITGNVKNISTCGLLLLPDYPSSLKDVRANTKLEDCSLRAGDSILTPICRIVRIDKYVSMEFLWFEDQDKGIWDKYLEGIQVRGI